MDGAHSGLTPVKLLRLRASLEGMRQTVIKKRGSGKDLDFKGHFRILEVEKIK